MSSVCLIGYLLLSGSIVVAAIRHKGGCLQYPFWAALTFTGFALPQFISLIKSGAYPGYSLEKYIIMAGLCLAATQFGFAWGTAAILGPKVRWFLAQKMDPRRLRWLSVMYLIVGGFFTLRLYLSGAQFSSQQWAGPSVIYLFFSGFMIYGFVVAADLYLHPGHRTIDLVLAFLGGMYLLLRAAVHGRRLSAVILFIVVVGLLWFRKRKMVPVPFIIAAILGGLLISGSMNAYRSAVADKLEFSRLADIDFIGTFLQSFTEGGASEISHGCYVVGTADRTLGFDFGAGQWNAVVWSFLPRQLVGARFKQSLMLQLNLEEEMYHVFQYTPSTGTTMTGVADSYLALSYAGCIKFVLIAFVLGVLYAHAECQSTPAIILYLLLLPRGCIAFTHGTPDFANALIMCAMCVVPGLMLCSPTLRPEMRLMPNIRRRMRG